MANLDSRETAPSLLLRLRDAQDAVAAGPTPYHYFHLAQAKLANKDRDGAKEAYDKIKSLGLTREMIHPLERPAFMGVSAPLRDDTAIPKM